MIGAFAMYMRFVRMNALADKVDTLIHFYDKAIIPVLQNTKGCRYACLIRSTKRPGECISLTLWESHADAEEYEKSGRFKQLYEKVRPLLEDSSEWKIRLTTDYTLEYQPESDEPVIDSYNVSYMPEMELPDSKKFSPMYVRILSARVKPELKDELHRTYKEEIGPGLRKVPGCKYAFLTQNLQQEDEFFSITIWENKQAAENYEKSGLFKEYIGKVQHTFADLYQWKMKLEEQSGKKVVTSEDAALEQYSVVTGKNF
jgi:quinol monooxygenase YgiN